MSDNLKLWIKEQQNTLDEIIAITAKNYLNLGNESGKINFIFDVQESSEELYGLSKGKDLCYDRPSIGFVYSTWFHGRRINTFLKYFIDILVNCEESHIEIFDLGAGTGAVQWALGIVYTGMKLLSMNVPKIKVINIDTSPFMLQYHSLLWSAFKNKYTECSDIEWEYKINSWDSTDNTNYTNPWIFASYLFDSNENREAISKGFTDLIKTYEPKVILLLTSNQLQKKEHLQAVSEEIQLNGYKVEDVNANTDIFEGDLEQVSLFRKQNSQQISGFRGRSSTANWKDQSFIGKIFRLTKSEQLSLIDKHNLNNIDLFKPPTKERQQVKLSFEQIKAAKHSNEPVIITGSAGSGKSIVVTERIKNLVEKENYSPYLNILLTTFNKELIFQLGYWLENILDPQKCKRIIDSWEGQAEETSKFYFHSSNSSSIRVMHFDVLPTRIGNIKGGVNPSDNWHIDRIQKIICEVSNQYSLKGNEFNDVLNFDFIQEELYRVYYGLQYKSKEAYLNGERTGRGKMIRLEKNSLKREVIWECLARYYNYLSSNNIHNFTSKRIKFLEILNQENNINPFTHIYVDEFQDCTKSDFEIFYKLLSNPNHLVVAGDLAQSIRLGRSYHIPRDKDMKRRKEFKLEGSYRLPYRITECIKELSKQIVKKHNGNPQELTPFKGAPPGSRPIVVFAKTTSDICKKIKDIFEIYQPMYGLTQVTILEKDKDLSYRLKKIGVPAETDSILRIKGLEKECVLWSVRTNVEETSEASEIVYTILTRTSCILIIALSGTVNNVYQEIIGTFPKDRLLFWDQETKDKYSEFWKEPTPINDDITEDE